MSISQLLPVTTFHSGFTTCPTLPSHYSNLKLVSFDDKALGVHGISSRTSHPLVTPPPPSAESGPGPLHIPPPSKAWEASYPQGSINPTAPLPGGFGFYLSGPPFFAAMLKDPQTKEVVLSYRIMLEDGWMWAKGGKLPGIFGGVGDYAYKCTGGRQTDRCKCFNLRPMWRPKGVGELYSYIPITPTNTSILLGVPPVSKQNPDYGFSVGRGAFTLQEAVGKWAGVAIRVKLNDLDANDPNGEMEVYINGVSVIRVVGLLLRDKPTQSSDGEGRIGGMHFQTFFGGHTSDWASPRDQRAWFADITGVVTGTTLR